MLGRAASHCAEFLHLTVATLYVVTTYVLMRLLFVPLIPFIHFGRVSRYDNLVERFPMPFLVGSIALVAFFAARGNLPFGAGMAQIIIGTTVWLLLLHTAGVAYTAATRNPARAEDFAAEINSRWPDRWYARHMKQPLNAIYIRRMITNSIMMVPAMLAIVVPGEISIYSVVYFALADIFTGMVQESIDHSDMHNNLFSRRHLPRGAPRAVLWLTNRYLRLFLNPVCLRIPHFYRVQHVLIHHAENNGVRDTQTTIFRDRTSFFDFCRHSLTMALSWSLALDVYAYLRSKRNVRQCRLLLLGLAFWFAALGLIALYNPAAALFFLLYRFTAGIGVAASSYFWHGLADPDQPENIHLNTVNLVPAEPGTPDTAELHVRHHERSAEHFSRQIAIGHADHERWREAGVLSLSIAAAEPTIFLKALLARRFDIIANLTVTGEDVKREDLLKVIEHRTKALNAKPRGVLYRRLDRFGALVLARYLLPGGMPPLEEPSG
jgi:hypothetical protein